jgi:hypothetical protein
LDVTVILWAILGIILIFWLLGFLLRVAGNAIHLLLLVALAILIYNILSGRRSL